MDPVLLDVQSCGGVRVHVGGVINGQCPRQSGITRNRECTVGSGRATKCHGTGTSLEGTSASGSIEVTAALREASDVTEGTSVTEALGTTTGQITSRQSQVTGSDDSTAAGNC